MASRNVKSSREVLFAGISNSFSETLTDHVASDDMEKIFSPLLLERIE